VPAWCEAERKPVCLGHVVYVDDLPYSPEAAVHARAELAEVEATEVQEAVA
jgi:hypothetical protein